MTEFLPVLLGSDANVYGMARSFFMEYHITSAMVCKARLVATRNTRFISEVVVEPRLEEDEVFVKTLTDFAAGHSGKTLVLLSCSDGYTILLARNRAALEPYYKFACPTEENVMNH